MNEMNGGICAVLSTRFFLGVHTMNLSVDTNLRSVNDVHEMYGGEMNEMNGGVAQVSLKYIP